MRSASHDPTIQRRIIQGVMVSGLARSENRSYTEASQ